MTQEKLTNNKPIRIAKQERSRQTIRNILDATALLIRQNGLEALTTNKVADRSGVNIASIYQYFPNKEALVNSLANQLLEEHSQKLLDLINNFQNNSVEEGTRKSITTGIELYRASEGLFFEIFTNINSTKQLSGSTKFVEGINEAGKLFLKKHQPHLSLEAIERRLYIISNAVLPLMYQYLLNTPSHTNDSEFIEEVVTLVGNYLK